MDDIVKAALAKWPNVPHCYGWLALDARGRWRMRDVRAQAAGTSGEIIHNAALIAFINRNYQSDQHGNWYFQNGPQRVYVDLAATPYIARAVPFSESDSGFVLHTGMALAPPDAAYLSRSGQLCLRAGSLLAQVDDRDLALCLERMRVAGAPASDECVLEWLAGATHALQLCGTDGRHITLERSEVADLIAAAGIVAKPAV